ncbi:RNI-like protein [Abortiporus biennis]|nr:RNI-like protein [Abortiporus biennis]
MSRRANAVRGPTSALTEFLRESGITPTTIARRVRTREVQQPEAGPSTAVESNDTDQQEGNSNRAQDDPEEYASDHLDESDEEPAPKKRKLSKAAEAKLKAKEKAKAKAKAKKDGDDDDYEDDEDEDAYTALSKMWKDNTKPPVGSFCNCAKCKKQFTVTKYTAAANPPPGFLCHPCAKSSGPDPFKKPVAPRKRRTATEKRTVVNFEERRFPSLASMCISIISSHIDNIEALGDISSMNMDELSKSLARNRSLTSQNAPLLYNAEHTNLILYDATNLPPSALCTLALLNPNLTTLRLDFCGRMDDEVMNAWTKSLPNLRRLELLGPFLVRVQAWQTFFESHPALDGFLITQSPRFDLDCMKSLVNNCPNLTELRLKEIGKIDDSFIEVLKTLGNGQGGCQLRYLDLSSPGIPDALTQSVLIELMSIIGSQLTHLDLSGNQLISDGFLLEGIKPHAKNLTCLKLSNVPELTDNGVAEFFKTWAGDSLPSTKAKGRKTAISSFQAAISDVNPPLSHIDFARNPELSSAALTALLEHSGQKLTQLSINQWRNTSEESLKSIAKYCPKLNKLDIGWCREADDWVVKEIMEKCPKIEEVKVFGCQRLTQQCPRKRNVNIYGVESH